MSVLWRTFQSRCSWLIRADKTVTNIGTNFQCKTPVCLQEQGLSRPLTTPIGKVKNTWSYTSTLLYAFWAHGLLYFTITYFVCSSLCRMSQDIPCHIYKHKVPHTEVHIYVTPTATRVFEIHFNIIFPSECTFPTWPLSIQLFERKFHMPVVSFQCYAFHVQPISSNSLWRSW